MADTKLLKTVSEATGLPQELVGTELKDLIVRAGLNESEVTLEDLRQVLCEYLQDVFLDAKSNLHPPKE